MTQTMTRFAVARRAHRHPRRIGRRLHSAIAAAEAAGRRHHRRTLQLHAFRISVKAGAPVEIRLRSDDTDHGFRILGTDINITIPKRGKGVATVTFVPPSAGRYVFECSKLCGAGHSFMRGTMIAE